MKKCQHRVFIFTGKDGEHRVKCSTCGLSGRRSWPTVAEAWLHRRDDFKEEEKK